MMRTIAVLIALVIVTRAGWTQPAPADGDQQRLEQERVHDFEEMARQQQPIPGVHVWGMAGDGRGRMMPIGPHTWGERGEAQIHVVGDCVYVVRGWMLRQFINDDELALGAEVDLRTEHEMPGDDGATVMAGGMQAQSVPVELEFGDNGDFIYVLRGNIFRQYFVEGLELLAEFDLRTDDEARASRVQIRMQPGPLPPPPPPDAVDGE